MRVPRPPSTQRRNTVLVGATSRGRKGTAHRRERVLEVADERTAAERVFSGLASGEG